ncbi:uncharacterized protein PAC_04733 [Phialocephala subalpina]|uniref:Uncharacterized protein n=1 Tax=Phialocephala subalpina TaxID=576137 RepID=A0A1L7WQ04_9HELO|nr:uncharacterized protein PAC_04733 [Phialocephala subalpina]
MGYESQEAVIARMASNMGVSMSQIQSYFDDSLQRVRRNYPPGRSTDWLLSRAEYLVWDHFFPADAFPGKIELPIFPPTVVNTEPVVKAEPAAKDIDKPDKPSSRSRSGYKSQAELIKEKTKAFGVDRLKPQGLPDKPPIALPPPDPSGYQHQEKTMEAMAMKLGIRREFFQFLQKARDQAREDHRDCSSGIRHFVADRITWLKFFKKPFPHRHPKEGHSPKCKLKHDSAERLRPVPYTPRASAKVPTPLGHSQVHGRQGFARASAPAPQPAAKVPVGQSAPSIPPADMIVALGNVRHVHHNYGGGIVLQGTEPTFCKVYQVDEILGCFRRDSSLATVGEGLKLAPGDGVALGFGQAFIQGWVKRVLVFGMVKPSFYWTEMQSTVNTIAVSESPPGAGTFQNSDTCLKGYRAGIGASEIDCLLAEEAAKREGHFRLVFDEATEVVTLKELLKRERYRASRLGTGNANLVPLAPLALRKRKPEGEGDSADKRMCM